MLSRSFLTQRTKVHNLNNFITRAFANSATLKCSETKVHKCDHPPTELTIKKDQLLNYYKDMQKIRRMEIAADTAYKSGSIRGFLHLYDGQEAIAVGIEAAIRPSDYIVTSYRCHGQQLLRGDSMKQILSELMGKGTGTSRGKGGSMHLYLPEKRFFGGNGIVGAQVPLGAGLALRCKYTGSDDIAVTLFGDGAANQGQVYETANMAALWKLPLIFVIENNKYGMGTAIERAAFQNEFYKRGDYIPGIQCNGLDVISTRAAMEYAANFCRKGNGPIFVEMKTYRFHGHSMSDPGKTYRTKDEVQKMRKQQDPILLAKQQLLDLGWATSAQLKQIDKEIRKEADEAAKYATKDKEIPVEERFKDIFEGEDPSFIRATDRVESVGSQLL